MLCNFFFFFKQKTAYEVRISDWSSDVCSSDLSQTGHPARPGAREGLGVPDPARRAAGAAAQPGVLLGGVLVRRPVRDQRIAGVDRRRTDPVLVGLALSLATYATLRIYSAAWELDTTTATAAVTRASAG